MWKNIKQWLGRSGPAAPTQEFVEGSSLDDDVDMIRQTQMLDHSVLSTTLADTVRPESRPDTPRRRGVSAAAPPVTAAFTPSLRPPMAFLAFFDDGSNRDSEIVRLRGGTHVIGREQGDVQFPHEVLMSSQHAEIACRKETDRFVWYFTDLNSRNGSFFRVQRATLQHQHEFLLGGHRFSFRMPLPMGGFADAIPVPEPDGHDATKTQMVGQAVGQRALPKLVYRGPDGREVEYTLANDHVVIGSDPATCALALPGDKFLSPNHARLFLDQGVWRLEDLGSRNATWLRLNQARLDQVTEFQLGEQRFYFRPHAPR